MSPHCLLVGTVDIAPTSLGTAPLGSIRLRLVCCPIQPSAGVFTQPLARKNRIHLRVGRPGAAMRHKESHFRITVPFEPLIKLDLQLVSTQMKTLTIIILSMEVLVYSNEKRSIR
jgi:hypothetical protein